MRLHRFYVSQPLGEEVVIEDVSIVKQWLKVFRYTRGDFVILFNGDGYDYTYQLQETSPTSCTLTQQEKKAEHTSSRKKYLFVSVIKKDLFELVVEKATECGITDIVPIIAHHTERKNLDSRRLMLIAKEATEQSGRGDIPTLHSTLTLKEAFDHLPTFAVSEKNTYIATLFGKTIYDELQASAHSERKEPIAFFVGPEGGWSKEEEEYFEKSLCKKISLSPTTLRAETAAIMCVTLSLLL